MVEHLLDRLYGEYQAYKVSVLSLSGAEIFSRCYEIDIMTNIYDILAEQAERFPENKIQALLGRQHILSELYDRWLKKDDDVYTEICRFVTDEAENIAAEVLSDSEGSAA
jgi:hypothetical protein